MFDLQLDNKGFRWDDGERKRLGHEIRRISAVKPEPNKITTESRHKQAFKYVFFFFSSFFPLFLLDTVDYVTTWAGMRDARQLW